MAFPTLGFLDQFNRADENPLGNGTWSGPAFGLSNQMKIPSAANAIAPQADFVSASYWSAAQFGPDIEIYATIPTFVSVNGTAQFLHWRVSSPTSSSWNGYRAIGDCHNDQITIQRVDGGTATTLGAVFSVSMGAGDAFGVEHIGSTISVYHKPSAGSWTLLGTRTDGTYNSAGYFAVAANISTGDGMDDFGGGTLAAAGVPQFFEVGDAMLIR